jgi:hypothetical protein
MTAATRPKTCPKSKNKTKLTTRFSSRPARREAFTALFASVIGAPYAALTVEESLCRRKIPESQLISARLSASSMRHDGAVASKTWLEMMM